MKKTKTTQEMTPEEFEEFQAFMRDAVEEGMTPEAAEAPTPAAASAS